MNQLTHNENFIMFSLLYQFQLCLCQFSVPGYLFGHSRELHCRLNDVTVFPLYICLHYLSPGIVLCLSWSHLFYIASPVLPMNHPITAAPFSENENNSPIKFPPQQQWRNTAVNMHRACMCASCNMRRAYNTFHPYGNH
jgi:hypothetical protein